MDAEKLNSFWKKALHNYTQEKKSLSEKIKNENEVCNVTITDEFQNYRLFSNHWRNVLFGHMDLLPQQSTTPTEFITRRL